MDIGRLLERVEILAKRFPGNDPVRLSKACLMDVGIRCDLDGYRYLAAALELWRKTPDAMISKDIYPVIARRFHVDCEHVAVGIRRAIQAAYLNQDEKWTCYFSRVRKPTNAEFITRLAEVIDFWEAYRSEHP